MRTEDPDDLAYLDELLASHAKYSKYVPGPGYRRYVGSWEAVQDPDAVYIKIDDDVVSGSTVLSYPEASPFWVGHHEQSRGRAIPPRNSH